MPTEARHIGSPTVGLTMLVCLLAPGPWALEKKLHSVSEPGSFGLAGCCSRMFRLLCGKRVVVCLWMCVFCSSYKDTRIWSWDIHSHDLSNPIHPPNTKISLIFYPPTLSQWTLSFNQETLSDIFNQYPNHSRIWGDRYVSQLLLIIPHCINKPSHYLVYHKYKWPVLNY